MSKKKLTKEMIDSMVNGTYKSTFNKEEYERRISQRDSLPNTSFKQTVNNLNNKQSIVSNNSLQQERLRNKSSLLTNVQSINNNSNRNVSSQPIINKQKDLKSTNSIWNRIQSKVNEIMNNSYDNVVDTVLYSIRNAGAGGLNSITGMAQSVNTDIANQINKGKKRKTSENIFDLLGAVTSPTMALSKLAGNTIKENVNILKDKNKNIYEKISDIGINSVSDSTNIIPTKQIINNGIQLLGKNLPENTSEKILDFNDKISKPSEQLNQKLAEEGERYGKGTQLLGSATQSVGNMIPSIMASVVTGNPQMGLATMALGVKGNSTQEALKKLQSQKYNSDKLDKAIKIGDTKAMIEVGTEMLTGGINIFGKGALDDILQKNFISKIKNEVGRFFAQQGMNFGGEVIEETISDVLGTLIDKGTVDPTAKYSLKDWSDTALTTVLSTAILNTLTGGFINDINSAQNRNDLRKDLQKNNNLTSEQVEEIQKNISEGEIESKDKLEEKIYDLTKKQPTTIENNEVLNSNKQVIQDSRQNSQNSISQQIEQDSEYSIKMPNSNYKFEVSGNKKIDNLRKDASKYWNNSKATKKLVANMEKIISDKDYYIRLDNSITDSKGNFVNGKITKENGETIITLNPNSSRAFEFLIGHEVGHAITTPEMKKLVIDFASKNNDFSNAIENLKQNYNVDEITDEVVSDIEGQILGNQEFIDSLSTEKPNIFKKIYDVIISIANKITGNSNEALFIRNLKNKYQKAYRETQGSNVKDGEISYSIQEDSNGGKYVKVDTDQDIFEGKSLKEQTKIAQEYILNNFREKGLLKNDTNINISRKTANEYTHPRNGLDNTTYSSKMKASTELDNLLKISQFIKSEADDGRHVFAKDGWDYYETVFKVGDKTYSGWLNIANGKNGKLLYDITNIKERASNYSVKTVSVANSSINNSIASPRKDVNTNTKYSIQESENNTGSFNLSKEKQERLKELKAIDISNMGLLERSKIKEEIRAIENGFDTVDDYIKSEKEKREKALKEAEKEREERRKKIAEQEKEDEGYQMTHRPTESGVYASDISANDFIPKDVYEHPEWYFDMNRDFSKESFNIVKKIKGNPEAEITIYRATPSNTINKGDWVTLSKKYAEYYNESNLNGKGNIVELKVKAKDVQYAGDDINEFGYFPQDEKYSKQNSQWQEYLEEKFKAEGTRTYKKDVEINLDDTKKTKNSEESSFSMKENKQEEINNIGKISKVTSRADKFQKKAERTLKDNIIKDFGVSKYANNQELLNIAIYELEEEFNKNGNISKETIDNTFKDLYEKLMKEDTILYDENKDIIKRIKNTKIYIDEAVKNSITDYNEFRKSNFGTLNLSNDSKNGIEIDILYKELSDENPSLFPENIVNKEDQLKRISEVMTSLRKTERNLKAYANKYESSEYRDWAKTYYEIEVANLKSKLKRAKEYRIEKQKLQENVDKTYLDYNEINELYSLRDELKKKVNKVDNSILLTEREKKTVKALLDGTITTEQVLPGQDREGILKTYYTKQQYDIVQKSIKSYKEAVKKHYNSEVRDIFENNSIEMKDKKSGIAYARETAQRNNEDVFDKETAKIVNKTFFDPVLKHEADRIKFVNEMFEKINDLKINTKNNYKYETTTESKTKKILKVNEADLAGLYLEGKLNDFYFENNNISKERIIEIADTFKPILDDIFKKMNVEYVKHGYDPIKKIQQYFPHGFVDGHSDSLIAKFTSVLGIDGANAELPTDIAGKTENFKPGRTWNANILHRTSQQTDIDALTMMEKYILSGSDVIYHTEDLQKLRAFEREIRNQYADENVKKKVNEIIEDDTKTELEKAEQIQKIYESIETGVPNYVIWVNDFTNGIANKKSKYDRSMEDLFGRNFLYKGAKFIENRVASNMIGGNVRVSVTNLGALGQALGSMKAGNEVIGAIETIKNASVECKTGVSDGFVDRSNFLTSRRGADSIHKKNFGEKVSDKFEFLNLIDDFASETIVRGLYREGLENGMTETDAMDYADNTARRIMGDRSKGAIPTIFNAKNPVVKAFTSFQVEPNNLMSYVLKDMPNTDKTIMKKTGDYLKICVGLHLANTIIKGIAGGTDLFPDPISILCDVIGYATADDDEDKEKAKNELWGDLIGQLPYAVLTSLIAEYGFGIDVENLGLDSSKTLLASAIPDFNKAKKMFDKDVSSNYKLTTSAKEWAKPLLYIGLPVAGNQINKLLNGALTLLAGGSYKYNENGEKSLQFPVENPNVIDGGKALIFGKYATDSGKKYLNSGYKTLPEKINSIKEDYKKGEKVSSILKNNLLPSAKDKEYSGLNVEQTKEYEKIKQNNFNINYYDFKKYVNATDKFTVKDKNQYIKYYDDNENVYWYDSKNKQLYNNDYSKNNNLNVKSLNKSTKAEELIKYIDTNMDLNEEQKYELYKYNIMGEKETEKAEYIINNNMLTKHDFLEKYTMLKENDISLPSEKILKEIKDANIKLSEYLNENVKAKKYNNTVKEGYNKITMPGEEVLKKLKDSNLNLTSYMKYETELTNITNKVNKINEEKKSKLLPGAELKDSEKEKVSKADKINIILTKEYTSDEKKAIYINFISDDSVYNNMSKITDVNIDKYLKYINKIDDGSFEADDDPKSNIKGKKVTKGDGTSKNKKLKYLEENFQGIQLLYLVGSNWSGVLTNGQKDRLFQKIDSSKLTREEKIDICKKLKDIEETKDGELQWK